MSRRLKILLAEDNPTNRHVATRMLARMGHAVDAVDDGAKAVSAAENGDYDAILMDMMMPAVDGLAATRLIRAGPPPRCHTVIIGLTANAHASDRAACEDAGMSGFVTKPVTMDRLRLALEQITVPGHATVTVHRGAEDPLLDTDFLNQLAEDIGLDGVAEVMSIFLEEGPARMRAIERGLAEQRILSVRREAHALAGAARNIGLTRLGEAAFALQKLCEGPGPDAGSAAVLAGVVRDTLLAAAQWMRAQEVPAT